MNSICKWFLVSKQAMLIVCLLVPLQAFSQQNSQPEIEFSDVAVWRILNQTNHPYFIKPSYLPVQNAIKDLYFLSPRPLIWLEQKNSSKLVLEALQLLESSEQSGLQASDYDLLFLKAKWAVILNRQKFDPYQAALFDTALSISVLNYLTDLRGGRIQPETVNFGYPQQENYEELVSLILSAVQKNEILQLTERTEPDFSPYRQLKQALKYYRQLQQDYHFSTILLEKSLEEGAFNPQVKLLREKLIALGELAENNVEQKAESELLDSLYQGEIIEAVKNFQRRHGLKVDGVVGKKTLAALNTPYSTRVRQIELALERFRWLPRLNRNEPLILVNIPAFKLWAFESGKLHSSDSLSMRVIVGSVGENETPIFMANLNYLEFRPYWNVPKKIIVDEILPKLQEDPDYLSLQNMELVESFGRFVEPLEFNLDNLSLLQNGEIKIRQRPGPKNSLGLIKFIFPNKYAVYLHDTPTRYLFKSERRDFSHGCIRVEQPKALAEFVLSSGKRWQSEKIREAMRNGNNRRVTINDSIPVLIFYSTAQVINDEVYFFDDIYGYDALLSESL